MVVQYLPVRSTLPKIDWTTQEEDQQDKQVWEDNWDDDKVADDFSIQLRWGAMSLCLTNVVTTCRHCIMLLFVGLSWKSLGTRLPQDKSLNTNVYVISILCHHGIHNCQCASLLLFL